MWRRLALSIAAIVLLAPLFQVARADYMAVGPAEVKLTLELVGKPPLPYQPARLRLRVCNVSGRKLDSFQARGPLKPLEAYLVVTVDGRSAFPLVFDKVPRGRVFNAQGHALSGKDRSWRFFEDGECASLSFALGAMRRDDPAGRDRAPAHGALFTKPGRYSVKYSYNDRLEAVLPIQVDEPEGDDRAVYELLQNDSALAAAVASAVDAPVKAVTERLRGILALYPKSSYADYARFALARYHRYGGDFVPNNPRYSSRVEQAIAIDYLTDIVSHTPSRPFPYLPSVMTALRTIDDSSNNRFTKELSGQYRDALEWLHVVAPTMDEVEWLGFRKQAVKGEK